ncbi:MAG: hypothetical protein U0414_04795 [Polyangiaceae bacterium]
MNIAATAFAQGVSAARALEVADGAGALDADVDGLALALFAGGVELADADAAVVVVSPQPPVPAPAMKTSSEVQPIRSKGLMGVPFLLVEYSWMSN